jgi:hypothetical protein
MSRSARTKAFASDRDESWIGFQLPSCITLENGVQGDVDWKKNEVR